jgi:hypothetical protein
MNVQEIELKLKLTDCEVKLDRGLVPIFTLTAHFYVPKHMPNSCQTIEGIISN